MRILVVSRSWPSNERSGVSLAAACHVATLIKGGFDVAMMGACPEILTEEVNGCERFHIAATGSGALYSPSKIDFSAMLRVFDGFSPELVIVEAWQTALTDAAVDFAQAKGIPVLMISHGISIDAPTLSLVDRIKAICWLPWRLRLPSRLRGLSALAVLDIDTVSPRFLDRQLAYRLGVPVCELANQAINFSARGPAYDLREKQIIIVGYYSRIKNQLAAIRLFANLPSDLRLLCVGRREGKYFAACQALARSLGVLDRVSFVEDHEISLADEIANSLLMLSTSITEVLPICLLEAMASGTPFVATPVGAVPSLRGGVVAAGEKLQMAEAYRIISEPPLWQALSDAGVLQYEQRFSAERVGEQLLSAVNLAMAATRKGEHG